MDYPYNIPLGFRFDVAINGITGNGECSFQDVGGLNVSIDVESIKEGGNNDYLLKIPGLSKYDNIVLKRGILRNSTLINSWFNDAIRNYKFVPKQVDIALLDEKNNTIISWALVNAYPVSIKISEFKAMDNAIAIETLELAYNYFIRNG